MCASRSHGNRGRLRRSAPKTIPDDLYDYGDDPASRVGPPRGSPPDVFDVEKLPVIDDWPEEVPITEAEIAVFERWFGDVFDEMFGSLDLPDGLIELSRDDKERP